MSQLVFAKSCKFTDRVHKNARSFASREGFVNDSIRAPEPV